MWTDSINCWTVDASAETARPNYRFTQPIVHPVVVLRARWPLIQDAIVHLGAEGLAKSGFNSTFVNISAALTNCSAYSRAPTDECGDITPNEALNDSAAVKHALTVAGFLDTSWAREEAAKRRFVISLSGSTPVTLIGDQSFWLGNTASNTTFTNDTRVTIGSRAAAAHPDA